MFVFLMFRKCTISESTGGRQKILNEFFEDFFCGLGAVWIVFTFVVQYERKYKIERVI
jgi:hypothetical protein